MGKHARIGLLVGASACLLAAMADWVVEELNQHGNLSAGKLAHSPTTCPAAATRSAAGHRAGGHT
jgi:phage terminase large subunit-like protein